MSVLFQLPGEQVWGSIDWRYIVRKIGQSRYAIYRRAGENEVLETTRPSPQEADVWVSGQMSIPERATTN